MPAEPRRSLPGGVAEVNAICRNSPIWVTTNRPGRKGVPGEGGGPEPEQRKTAGWVPSQRRHAPREGF